MNIYNNCNFLVSGSLYTYKVFVINFSNNKNVRRMNIDEIFSLVYRLQFYIFSSTNTFNHVKCIFLKEGRFSSHVDVNSLCPQEEKTTELESRLYFEPGRRRTESATPSAPIRIDIIEESRGNFNEF